MATFVGQPDTDDSFAGTSDPDSFYFAAADLNARDSVSGSSGTDSLIFTTAGLLAINALARVKGIEIIRLANGTNSITLTNDQFSGVTASAIKIYGGSGADIIDASRVTGPRPIDVTGGGGVDTLLGGASNDKFRFAASQLSGDTIRGNGGEDWIIITTPGTLSVFDLSDVQGIKRFKLADGTNTIQLSNVNFFNLFGTTVVGGSGADTIDASRVTDNTVSVRFEGGLGADLLAGGAGNDFFRGSVADLSGDVIQGNGGTDTLFLASPGAFAADALSKMTGVEVIELSSNGNGITLINNNFTGGTGNRINIIDKGGDDRVDASGLVSAYSIEVEGDVGTDTLIGGSGNDMFHLSVWEGLVDTVVGNGGRDTVDLMDGTHFLRKNPLANVRSVEIITLADEDNNIILEDANFSGVQNARIKLIGGTAADTIDASAVAVGSVELLGGAGVDVLRGGSGNDLFRTSASHLIGDTLHGNGGYDTLSIESPIVQGVNVLAGVQGIERISLADGSNRISLNDANFAGVVSGRIAVSGGSGADRIDGIAVTAPYGLDITGGRGRDLLTGGSGADQFSWLEEDEGGDLIAGFTAGTDKLAFHAQTFAMTGDMFDVRTVGNEAVDLSLTDLFICSNTLSNATAVQALLADNGTGNQSNTMFVVARDSSNHSILYYAAAGDGSEPVSIIADLGTSLMPASITLGDFQFF